MQYIVKRASGEVSLSAEWDDPVWEKANIVKPEFKLDPSCSFHPEVACKMLYDSEYLYGMYSVRDKYVRAVAKRDQAQVCRDSCVELFIQPQGCPRYFNFEFSGNGRLLLYRNVHLRSGDFMKIPLRELAKIKRFHTLPDRVFPEIEEEVSWRLAFAIPLDFFVKYASINKDLSGQVWRGNFTKCADHSSHFHWLSWVELPISDFHYPQAYEEIVFE